jgi:uncharacterized phage protein (TIGR01671 family)
MSREIKFRAWDRDHGEMVYQSPTVDAAKIISRYDVVMQYTGLRDRNGKEIFEGDIVRSTYQRYGTGEEFVLYGTLVYDAPWWVIDGDYMWHEYEVIEVIGNIHEKEDTR